MTANPSGNSLVPHTFVHRVEADGINIFYREAGPKDAPVVLLLHGFPTSSFQYRHLIPRLADRYRVIAPDLPGFGFTEVPAASRGGWPSLSRFLRRLGQFNSHDEPSDVPQVPLFALPSTMIQSPPRSLLRLPGAPHNALFVVWGFSNFSNYTTLEFIMNPTHSHKTRMNGAPGRAC